MRRLLLTAVGLLIVGFGVALGTPLRSGKPSSSTPKLQDWPLLKGRYVELVLSGPDGKFPNRPELMRAETDANGVAEFRFETMPAKSAGPASR